MTRTVNRQPNQVSLPSNKAVKDYYFNHYNWKGICDDKNFLEVDQETFAYSENVYVDSESRLRSRPSVKFESKPKGLSSVWYAKLVRAWTFNDIVFEQYTSYTSSAQTTANGTKYVFRKNMPLYGDILTYASVDYISGIVKPILVDNYIFIFSSVAIHRYSILDETIVQGTSTDVNKNSIYIPNTKVISADNQETTVESKNALTTYEIYTYLYNRESGYSMDLLGKTVTIKIDDTEYSIVFDVNTPIVTVDKVNQFYSDSASNYYVFVSKLNGVAILNQTNNMLYFSANGGKVFDYLGTIPNFVHELPKFTDDGYYITCVTSMTANGAPDAVYIISALADAVDSSLQKRYPAFTRLSDNWPEGIKGFSAYTFLSAHFTTYNLGALFSKTDGNSTVYHNHIIDETDENDKVYFISDNIDISKSDVTNFPYNYSLSDVKCHICDFYKKDGVYYVTSAVGLTTSAISGEGVVVRKITIDDMGQMGSNGYYQATMSKVYTNVITAASSSHVYGAATMKHLSEGDVQYVAINYTDYCHLYTIDNTGENVVPSGAIPYTSLTPDGIIFDDAYKYPSYISDDGTMLFCSGTKIVQTSNPGAYLTDLLYVKANTYCGYLTGIIGNPTSDQLNSVVDTNVHRYPTTGDVVKVNSTTVQALYTYVGGAHPWIKTDYLRKTIPCGYTNCIYYTVYESDYNAVDPDNTFSTNDTEVNRLELFTSNTDKTFEFKYSTDGEYFPFIPDHDNQLSEVYLSKGNILYISEHKTNDDGQFVWDLPEVNKQTMNYPITALHPISNTEMAIFNDREVWYVYYDTNLNGYAYTKSKLQVGVQDGSDIITTYDGTTVLFVCERGAVALSYQDFIASTEQKLTYISDRIYNLFKAWNVGPVKIYSYDLWIAFYKTTSNDGWLYDMRTNSWWYFKNFVNNEQWLTAVALENGNKRYVPRLINGQALYKLHLADTEYYDTDSNGKQYIINWNLLSQKLYLQAVNYFKHITNITLNTAVDELNPVIMNYKMDIINYRHDTNIGLNSDVFTFSVDTIRTFVKRVNYMKVLEFQYALKANKTVAYVNQRPLSLCAITVRYKITGKVR